MVAFSENLTPRDGGIGMAADTPRVPVVPSSAAMLRDRKPAMPDAHVDHAADDMIQTAVTGCGALAIITVRLNPRE